jgi:peptide/nickel transport system permease protein
MVAAVILLIFILVAIVRPILPLPDPNALSVDTLSGPTPQHPFGTDNLGRDVLSRVAAGVQTALLVAVIAAALSFALGVALGALAGYFGKWIDDMLSRTFDVFLLLPAFFVLILTIALFGASLWLVSVVIGLTIWPSSARIMRSQTLTYKTRVFIDAARAIGASPIYVLTRHVLPNSVSPVITNSTILMGQAILTEAGLSFLGLGDPSTISWGRMIYEGQTYLQSSASMSVFPGAALLVMVMCFNIAGDGLTFALSGQRRSSET